MLCGLEGEDTYTHRPDWEHELHNNWYFDVDHKCRFQEEEHGPLAKEQFRSTVGTLTEVRQLLTLSETEYTAAMDFRPRLRPIKLKSPLRPHQTRRSVRKVQ